ncbi:PREDICTED: cell division cycle protein 20 homolog, partial [Papilio polytes]|uniref:cell division cycle protein 20 homolog n=1 Tax=Papilio polytes TaxID=76194 RepID=UPI000675FB94
SLQIQWFKCNTGRWQSDRFVPAREAVEEKRRRNSWPKPTKSCDLWDSNYLQQKKHAILLYSVLGINDELSKYQQKCPAWPCAPRQRKYLSPADSILDLPRYGGADFPELLDWGSDNVLVAALGRIYYKWSWKTQNIIKQSRTTHQTMCCKFHPKAEYLALGTTGSRAEIHDNELSKCMNYSYCKCHEVLEQNTKCAITAFEWSPTGNSYVMGCSEGRIRSFTNDYKSLAQKKISKVAILLLRISPDARFIAVTSVLQDNIYLLCWPSFELYSSLGSPTWTVKAMNWHPWRSALLGVGTVTKDINARILMWDVPAGSISNYGLSDKNYYLDTMRFNHRSGELVISLFDPSVAFGNSQLVVLSDHNTAVDHWGDGRKFPDRVRYMIFNPEGTLLASATSAEDLIIWKFLPEDKKRKNKSYKFTTMPVYLDITTIGYSVR